MKYCTKCGNSIGDEVTYCEKCGTYKYAMGSAKKKDSVLSILSCVFAGVTMIFPTFVGLAYMLLLAAIIIAIVDLAMKDDTKRHIGSWFGLIAGIIIFLIVF